MSFIRVNCRNDEGDSKSERLVNPDFITDIKPHGATALGECKLVFSKDGNFLIAEHSLDELEEKIWAASVNLHARPDDCDEETQPA